jgi:hypothetical protein
LCIKIFEVKINMDMECSRNERRSAFKMLIGNPKRKRLLGSPMHSWKDNIRIYLKEIYLIWRNLSDSTQYKNYWRVFVNATLKVGLP